MFSNLELVLKFYKTSICTYKNNLEKQYFFILSENSVSDKTMTKCWFAFFKYFLICVLLHIFKSRIWTEVLNKKHSSNTKNGTFLFFLKIMCVSDKQRTNVGCLTNHSCWHTMCYWNILVCLWSYYQAVYEDMDGPIWLIG